MRRAPVAVLKAVRALVGPFSPPLASLLGMMIGQAGSGDAALPPPAYEAFGVTPTSFAEYVQTLAGRAA